MVQLSVLMSLYIKEKTEYAKACFDSLLRQTVQADEWVIVEDGPLSDEMYSLLDKYQEQYPSLIKRVSLENNQGLGEALRIGVPQCKNELIARMDTDDIAREDRFEKQLAEFDRNTYLDICGSNIDEFEVSPDLIVAKRVLPTEHEDIVEYQKRRDAFNHMTVMYKKKAVLDAGNYLACPLMEDTYLWVRMIQHGAQCKNIGESLVYVRIGNSMYKRRGGWQYFLKYRTGKKKVLETRFITLKDYYYTLFIQLIVAILPSTLRAAVYRRILHKNR